MADDVETALRRGELYPGGRLAPVRAVAMRAGVSPATVAASYQELARRGLARGDGRRGTRILERPTVAVPATLPVPAGLRDLATGNPDPALLPDLAAALARLEPPSRGYGAPAELPALVAWAHRQFEADSIPATEIAVVNGALDGVERVLATVLRPRDRVLVEDPGYPPVFDLLRAFGADVVPVAVDDEGLDPAALRRALEDERPAAVVCTPRAQNPTGAAFSPARVRALRRVMADHPGVLVVEDDHAGGVAGVPALTVAGARPHWAVVRSVAKSLGPDLRLALLTGDDETVARVRGRQQLGPGWVSHLTQGLAVALASGPGLGRAAREYSRRRRALVTALQRRGVPASGRSGLNVWVPVADEQAAVAAMAAAGYAVSAGARFRIRSSPAVRVTIATLEPVEATVVADALALGPRGTRLG